MYIIPLDNLRRREKQLEHQRTYSMDDECKRMVCMEAVRAAIAAVESGKVPS